MAKNLARQLKDDDYFAESDAEPDYDKLSDEELDDLYNFGEIRSAAKSQKKTSQAKSKQAHRAWSADDDENWLDIELEGDEDLDGDEDLYDDY